MNAKGKASARGAVVGDRLYVSGAGVQSGFHYYEKPPERFVIAQCAAGDTVYASRDLTTESGQTLGKFNEHTLDEDGAVYVSGTETGKAAGWISR